MAEVKELIPREEAQGTTKYLKLRKPILINGEEVHEIPYDFESMTIGNKLAASREMANAGYAASNVEELDPVYHLFLFAKAVEVGSGQKIATSDILRLSARDGQAGAALARSFFYLSD